MKKSILSHAQVSEYYHKELGYDEMTKLTYEEEEAALELLNVTIKTATQDEITATYVFAARKDTGEYLGGIVFRESEKVDYTHTLKQHEQYLNYF